MIGSSESKTVPMDESGRSQKGSGNISVYSEMARQGGHRDLLSMEGSPEPEVTRRQKGRGNLSHYSEMARQGGHKGLLSMEHEEASTTTTTDECDRKQQKNCENVSEYTAIAIQGGHKDLLTIDDPDASDDEKNNSNSSRRTYGDWYQGDPKNQEAVVANAHAAVHQTPSRDLRRGNGNCIVPGDDEEETPSRCGKKMFGHSNIRQEAPFATNY